MPAGLQSRAAALVSLLIMIAALLLPVPTPWSGTVAFPLIILFAAGCKPPRKWGGWAAVTMVPYFCIALGEVIANPAERFMAGLLAVCATIAFFAALDFNRRTGVSLRS